jgi:hypothetical protein
MEILQNNIDSIILILLLIIGLGIIIFNIILIKKGEQTLNWFEVKGSIKKSEVNMNPSLDFTQNYYKTSIEYEYEVFGIKYLSNQAYLGDVISSNKSKARETVKMFPINKTVTVFVNPDNHTESVLIKGSGGNRVLNIVIGLFLIVAGVLVKINYELITNTIKGLEK